MLAAMMPKPVSTLERIRRFRNHSFFTYKKTPELSTPCRARNPIEQAKAGGE
jgi:hypothetical protein